MDGFPVQPFDREVIQIQGYISFTPTVVRIRKTVEGEKKRFQLTIKGKGTLARTEVEVDLAEDQYQALEDVVPVMAQKRLRTFSLPGGHVLECSLVDEGEATAFYFAEVEFESEEQALDFVPPAFLGREVTEVAGYTMAAYCREKQNRAEQQEKQKAP